MNERNIVCPWPKQDVELNFWRIVVPDRVDIKEPIVRELHSTPYSADPGIQRTIAKVRRFFYWKSMLGDVRQLVENCPVFQTEKSDHTLAKGKLQSTHIPETKWSEISVDFIMNLPSSANNKDTILATVDKATRVVHLAPYRKNITAAGTAQLLWKTVLGIMGFQGLFIQIGEPSSLRTAGRSCGELQGQN